MTLEETLKEIKDPEFYTDANTDIPMLLEMVEYLIQNSRPLGNSNDIRNFKVLKSDLENIVEKYT